MAGGGKVGGAAAEAGGRGRTGSEGADTPGRAVSRAAAAAGVGGMSDADVSAGVVVGVVGEQEEVPGAAASATAAMSSNRGW